MAVSKTQKIIRDDKKNEIIMLRVDKTLKEMMEELPSSRWSAEYWHPYYDHLFSIIRRNRTVILDNHRDEIKSGYRSGGVNFVTKGYPYLQVRNILDTGVDLLNVDLISADSPARQENKKVLKGDILLNRSGQGSVGRLTVFLSDDETYVGGHVYRFAVKGLSPIYTAVFLKTIYGKEQIHRFESGVSGKTEIDLEEILHIEIPLLENKHIEDIELKYRKMSDWHDKAMIAKKEKNKNRYKEYILEAENLLNDLVINTETLIQRDLKGIN